MKTINEVKVLAGKSYPLGATPVDGGVNFSIFSRNATGMDLVLFPSENIAETSIIKLDPEINRTYSYWHAFVPNIGGGQTYGFRVYGRNDPAKGLRFDPEKLLLDPYARALSGWDVYDRSAAAAAGGNLDKALRSVVVDTSQYDWENDVHPRTAFADTVIYEMHVGGMTRNPNSGVHISKRGTFSGLIEKLPYLKELGITALELMPVQEFDPVGVAGSPGNYWGYSTVAFFAPHHGYCRSGDTVNGINEFKDLVKACHKLGLEVIMDVVFNHTSEGDERGPTHSFRGLDNPTYYLLEPGDRARYSNFTGCGNSFNANHQVAGRLILDCLRYWVSEMHVDGFRFDLAAALARDVYGHPMALPPLLWAIECDPILAGTKLIAEAWDAAGLYRVGWFVNSSNWYAEWNGPYRDDVRKFLRGDRNSVGALAARIAGSGDIYAANREPNRSVNFITCHDGFTLHDVTAYNQKHNEANGEDNRDGADANFSWNCGHEGESNDSEVLSLRQRQMKNAFLTLLVSQGTPMILMGDEVARSQQGNNNAYCQDNELSWFDWSLVQENSGLLRFVQQMVAFTQSLDIFQQRKPLASVPSAGAFITWHGVKLNSPDWGADSHSLAFTLEHTAAKERLHVMFNSYWEPLEFELPQPGTGQNWLLIADTAKQSPADIQQPGLAVSITGSHYTVASRAAVILMSGIATTNPAT